jgi:hypothetical protein
MQIVSTAKFLFLSATLTCRKIIYSSGLLVSVSLNRAPTNSHVEHALVLQMGA